MSSEQFLDKGILKGWHSLLQEIELAKNHKKANLITSIGMPAPNPILDYLLPSLLYIKMVSLLDEVLDFYIDHKNLTIPRNYRKRLNGKIDFLNDRNLLLNAGSLHRIRERRNELAHEVQRRASWGELDDAFNTIEAELQNLDLIGERPVYEFYAERSGPRDSPREEIRFIHDYCYGLKRDGKKVIEISWSVEYSGP